MVEGGSHGCLLVETEEPEKLTHISLSSGERDWIPFFYAKVKRNVDFGVNQ